MVASADAAKTMVLMLASLALLALSKGVSIIVLSLRFAFHLLDKIVEAGQDARVSSVDRMRAAMEAAGVIFIAENGDGASVRLRKS
jgi:hypothetical protein